MPTGKVKFYDTEKGFGFISGDDGVDVFLPSSALPDGVSSLKGGTKVDYSVVEGRRGAQAMTVQVLDAPSVSANRRDRDRRDPEEMVVIVEDLIKLLDDAIAEPLRHGRYPDKAKASAAAQVMRAVAADLG